MGDSWVKERIYDFEDDIEYLFSELEELKKTVKRLEKEINELRSIVGERGSEEHHSDTTRTCG